MSLRKGLVVVVLLAATALLGGCFLFPNQPPVAAFVVDHDHDPNPMVVRFDASVSTDPDDDPIVSYAWAFSDDLEIISPAATTKLLTQPELVVRFPHEGTYTIQLLVRDDQGAASAVVEADVTVPNP